jgi:hypothetical protein
MAEGTAGTSQDAEGSYIAQAAAGGTAIAINFNFYYHRGSSVPDGLGLEELVHYLQEWKKIHHSIQDLLQAMPLIERQVLGKIDIDEVLAGYIEQDWLRHCQPRVTVLRECLGQLKYFGNHKTIELLRDKLDDGNRDYVRNCITALRVDDPNSVSRLKSSVDELYGLLYELLSVSDLYICDIAGKLERVIAQ